MSAGRVIASDLIVAAQAGDHAAIVAVLQTAQRDIRRYARRTCRLEDVDDAVQETLATVSMRIGTLRKPAAFAGWLFVVVTRECYRLSRLGLRLWQPLDGVENALGLAHRPEAELRYDLGMAIQSLPAHYRSIVVKRDLEEMTIAEIAAAEGLTRETVKARLRRARLMMREYLSD